MSSARHHVTRVEDRTTFDAEARPRFEVDEAKCTIALTILAGLRAGVFEEALLYRVADEAGNAEVFAMRTPPFPLVVALGERAPLEALGRFVAEADPALPGVTGPADASRIVAAATGRAVAEEKPMRLYVCRGVIPPSRPPSGRGRLASSEEMDALVEFYEAFADDVKMPVSPPRPTIERALAEKRLFVWEDDGALVCMTQRTAPSGRCSRVNLVYTPPKYRGRGYASGLVAQVTKAVLDEAAGAFACLFTDLNNPTSNAIYQAVGYEPVSDFAEIRFV